MAAPQVKSTDAIDTWVDVTNSVGTGLGDQSQLHVGANAVSGVNTLNANVGNVADLTTDDKSSVVNALNEIADDAFIMSLALGTQLT